MFLSGENRSLEGSEYPFFMCDALYMKVRENHRIVSKGVYIGIGIDSDGRRTILGFDVQDGESEDNWDTVFQSFVQRGLFGVKLVISVAHKGLVKAVRKNFLGASWQRCQAHFLRNIFDKLPKKVSSDVKDELKSIFKASELELTRERKEHFLEKYGCDSKLSAACDILENGFEDAIQILSFPENIRRISSYNQCVGTVERRDSPERTSDSDFSKYQFHHSDNWNTFDGKRH